MINIEIYRNKNGSICGFCLCGHANFAESGSDIVCSAVSVLVFNTLNSIEKFTCETIEYSMDESGGFIRCYFTGILQGVLNHDASLLLNSLYLGLQHVKADYGKYINIKDLEV